MGRYSSDPAERARQLHAEGKFGGPKFGAQGGRAAHRHSAADASGSAREFIARSALDHKDELLAVVRDAIKAGQLPRHRLAGLQEWLRAEEREARREEREQQRADEAAELERLQSMAAPELVEHLVAQISGSPMLGEILRARLAQGAPLALDGASESAAERG